MGKSIIIHKILMNYVDFETGGLALSEKCINLETELLDFYHKKIENTLCNPFITKVTNVNNDIKRVFEDGLFSEENFIDSSKKITNVLGSLGSQIEDMPNSNIMFTHFKCDDCEYFGVIKLNFKDMPKMVTKKIEDKNTILLATKQQFVGSPSKADEAIFYCVDDGEMYLIEKKFKIDGKGATYLNEYWLKGNKHLNDKEKFDALIKVISKINRNYSLFDKNPLLLIRNYVSQYPNGFNVHKSVKSILNDCDNKCVNEAIARLNGVGIDENENIIYFKDVFVTKIKTDNGFEIKGDTINFLTNDVLEIIEEDGMFEIRLKGLYEIEYK